MSHDSVSQWLGPLQQGNERAAQEIWEQYYAKLVALARKKLHIARRVADEEDVAISAFNSFYHGAAAGKFPQLTDRDDLWRLLVTITARKARALERHNRAQKRGSGDVRGESVFRQADGELLDNGIGQVVGDEPSPEFAAEIAEEFRERIDQLEDDTLKRIAFWKLEGYSNDEISAKLDCASRTVERKLQRIRDIWNRENGGQ